MDKKKAKAYWDSGSWRVLSETRRPVRVPDTIFGGPRLAGLKEEKDHAQGTGRTWRPVREMVR